MKSLLGLKPHPAEGGYFAETYRSDRTIPARDGSDRGVTLGNDLSAGMRPQIVVPGGVWQGARLVSGGSFALLGTTMSPGFDIADFETGRRDALVETYPRVRDRIIAMTKPGGGS